MPPAVHIIFQLAAIIFMQSLLRWWETWVLSDICPRRIVFEDIISTGLINYGVHRAIQICARSYDQTILLRSVRLGRGERLKAGSETVLRGQIWLGTEA